MIQIQEPSRSHVNNDVIINQRLSDFVRDRFDSQQSGTTRLSPIYVGDNGPLKNNQDNSNTNNIRLPETNEAELNLRQNQLVNETGKSSDQDNSEEYGIINENSIVAGMSKCTVSEENRTSVFDDSDYDEVLDFMTSPSPKTNEDGGAGGGAKRMNQRLPNDLPPLPQPIPWFPILLLSPHPGLKAETTGRTRNMRILT
uniref:Uncharacterized protein n=1 Tax=Ciona savignyi TaxID=51511 RepID=H2ZIH7_CIOSA